MMIRKLLLLALANVPHSRILALVAGFACALCHITSAEASGVFDVTPSVTAQTETNYTITGSLDGAGTVYAVACENGSTAPTGSQVASGDCTGDATAEAAASDTPTDDFSLLLDLTGSDSSIHDLYVWDGTTLVTLADEVLTLSCASPSGTVIAQSPDPGEEIGDQVDLTVSTGSCAHGNGGKGVNRFGLSPFL